MYNNSTRNNDPITSFGLIIYHRAYNGDIHFLVQQRRDTFEYMDFVRGMWKNENQAKHMFTRMTLEERDRIRKFNFERLWDDLFVEKNCKMYKDFHYKARKKYDNVKHLIPEFLDETKTLIHEPPWGFPKGKKSNTTETNLDCAIRETEEETRINKQHFNVNEEDIYYEHFQGSNGKYYATHYYLAEMKDKFLPCKIYTPDCIRMFTVSEEVQEMVFAPYNIAMNFLSDNIRRQEILTRIVEKLNTRNKLHTNFI